MTHRTGGFMGRRLLGVQQELAKDKKTEKRVWTTYASRDERLKPPESPVAAALSPDLVSGSVWVGINTMHHTSHDSRAAQPLHYTTTTLHNCTNNVHLCKGVGGGEGW